MGRIIPYMKWKIKAMFETTNQIYIYIRYEFESSTNHIRRYPKVGVKSSQSFFHRFCHRCFGDLGDPPKKPPYGI